MPEDISAVLSEISIMASSWVAMTIEWPFSLRENIESWRRFRDAESRPSLGSSRSMILGSLDCIAGSIAASIDTLFLSPWDRTASLSSDLCDNAHFSMAAWIVSSASDFPATMDAVLSLSITVSSKHAPSVCSAIERPGTGVLLPLESLIGIDC